MAHNGVCCSGETCNYLSFEDIVPETALDKNFRKLNPTLSNYSSDVMRIRIHQWESENFDAIRVACNEKTTFRVSGLGIVRRVWAVVVVGALVTFLCDVDVNPWLCLFGAGADARLEW